MKIGHIWSLVNAIFKVNLEFDFENLDVLLYVVP
jgi:hypothetical protein